MWKSFKGFLHVISVLAVGLTAFFAPTSFICVKFLNAPDGKIDSWLKLGIFMLAILTGAFSMWFFGTLFSDGHLKRFAVYAFGLFSNRRWKIWIKYRLDICGTAFNCRGLNGVQFLDWSAVEFDQDRNGMPYISVTDDSSFPEPTSIKVHLNVYPLFKYGTLAKVRELVKDVLYMTQDWKYRFVVLSKEDDYYVGCYDPDPPNWVDASSGQHNTRPAFANHCKRKLELGDYYGPVDGRFNAVLMR
jgi:hypothetical protein